MRGIIRLAAVASFIAIGVAGIAAPAFAQAGEGLAIGMSLRKVSFADGWFEQQADGGWTEFNAQGRAIYHFREQTRTQEAVKILDPSRNTAVEFHLPRRIIRISFNGSPFEDLYPITATQHRNPGAPVRPTGPINPLPVNLPAAGYATQELFKVEAGSITSQTEAQGKCPALANRLGSEWSGGWERRDGRLSVCVLLFRK